jgi:hypothetical protein
MASSRIDRLFHSLVVLGAAMGAGCGGNVEVASSGANTGGGQGGDSTTGSGAGDSTGTAGAGGLIGTGGTTTTTSKVIDDPSDCEHSSQFVCANCPDCGCMCDPNLPAGPEDCGGTQHFHCQSYDPQYATCYCDPNSPEKPEDCASPGYFYCDVQDPPTGCHCVVPIA